MNSVTLLKFITPVKNVQLAEIALYNLRHHGGSYFCHFSIRKMLESTPIRPHIPTEKRHKNCERYNLNTYCRKYGDVKLFADNTR